MIDVVKYCWMIDVIKYCWMIDVVIILKNENLSKYSKCIGWVFFCQCGVFQKRKIDSVESPGPISLLYVILIFASMMQFANWILKSNSEISG